MKRDALVSLTLLTVFVALSLAAKAEDVPKSEPGEARSPLVWQPRTKSVAVFKNGMGFFVRQGPASLREGWCAAKEIPAAKFGTLAVYAAKESEQVDVIGSGPGEIVEFDDIDAPQALDKKRTRLEAAANLSVQLTYDHHGAEHTAAGKLVSLGPDFAVLDSAGNSFAVPVAGIKKMQVLDLPLRLHVSGAENQPAVGPTEIGMAYLLKALLGLPEYSLVVLDENTAELTLRGTLVNEAEDLIHCDVNFVVGVPHFAHTEYLAPIAVGQVIRSLGAAVAPHAVQQQIGNRAAIASNSAQANQFDQFNNLTHGVVRPRGAHDGAPGGSALANLPQLDVVGSSDFTVYAKKDLTVRRGERAIVTLFSQKIKYSHVYRWTPPPAIEHSLVLKNDTDSAWTTGPCLATSREQPLSEDLLRYTPRGGRCEIPVTTSVNIAHAKKEEETQRKLDARAVSKTSSFDLVTLDGELRLQNFEKRPVELIVSLVVPGRPTSASDNGEKALDAEELQLLKRSGSIRWTLQLKADESKVLKYQYERYVPSN